MNRVNMKQTESKRESTNYAARQEIADCVYHIANLEKDESAGMLNATGRRQLAKYRTKLAELTEEN